MIRIKNLLTKRSNLILRQAKIRKISSFSFSNNKKDDNKNNENSFFKKFFNNNKNRFKSINFKHLGFAGLASFFLFIFWDYFKYLITPRIVEEQFWELLKNGQIKHIQVMIII